MRILIKFFIIIGVLVGVLFLYFTNEKNTTSEIALISEKYTEVFTNPDQDGLESVLTKISSVLDQHPNNTEALFLRFNIYNQLNMQENSCVDLKKLNNLEHIAERVFGECIYCLKDGKKQIGRAHV